jgi:hypothetical protein
MAADSENKSADHGSGASPSAVFKPGQSWMIPAGTPHDAKAGSGAAKVIAVYAVEKGKPLAAPAD